MPIVTTMNDPRAAECIAWTRRVLDKENVELVPASADASFRRYFRTLPTASVPQTLIVMDAPPGREDIGAWLEIGARLEQAGLNVPHVLAADREHGFVLMSDLGNRAYLPALSETTVDALYNDALMALLRLQAAAGAENLPSYDREALLQEMELLPEWFLKRHLGFAATSAQRKKADSVFSVLATNALEQPQVFVHRDFHSRNLMLTERANPGLLDFQDARRGPITYDLVSLLRDCYIVWPAPRVYGWMEQYRRQACGAGLTTANAAQFRRWFDLMGLQRHLKVLGIFCRLWYRDGKAGYLADLPRVWHYVQTMGARYPETAPLVALIENAIVGRDISLKT